MDLVVIDFTSDLVFNYFMSIYAYFTVITLPLFAGLALFAR